MDKFDIVNDWLVNVKEVDKDRLNKIYCFDNYLNTLLWHGSEAHRYFVDNPQDYNPENFEQAESELLEMIGEINETIYVSEECDCVMAGKPDYNEDYWIDDFYIGPLYEETTVAKVILYKEVYDHII